MSCQSQMRFVLQIHRNLSRWHFCRAKLAQNEISQKTLSDELLQERRENSASMVCQNVVAKSNFSGACHKLDRSLGKGDATKQKSVKKSAFALNEGKAFSE